MYRFFQKRFIHPASGMYNSLKYRRLLHQWFLVKKLCFSNFLYVFSTDSIIRVRFTGYRCKSGMESVAGIKFSLYWIKKRKKSSPEEKRTINQKQKKTTIPQKKMKIAFKNSASCSFTSNKEARIKSLLAGEHNISPYNRKTSRLKEEYNETLR